MVIGKGVIAHRFLEYALQSRFLIFAGSVHDSRITDDAAIAAEEEALRTALLQSPQHVFVYFSTCSALDPNESSSPYVLHKLRMEKLIQSSSAKYLIVRLPQLLGLGDTPTGLVTHLVDAIVNDKRFELWEHAEKNLIDIDDVFVIVRELLANEASLNRVVNVGSDHTTPVAELVDTIAAYFGRTPSYDRVAKGTRYAIDITATREIIGRLGIDFGRGYLLRALDKYFRHLTKAPRLISIIVPTYNEEGGIEMFHRRTKAVLDTLAPRFTYEIIFVNDFSTDNTYAKLQELAHLDPCVRLINFSRNFGNQIAITAGIDHAGGDIAVIIDDDLQDPPEVILNFIALWSKGYKVVYGVRPKRQGVNPMFKLMAKIYYRTISALSETKIPNDTGDFRLVDRVVIASLKEMREENRYYRGMVAWVGFSQVGWSYERDRRYAGESTFSLKKYINFAFNGLTSFTDKPLYVSSLVGFVVASIGFLLAGTLVIEKIIDPSISIRGWTSLMALTTIFGGVQLFSIGILGIYISKINREVKRRPLYITDQPLEPRATSPKNSS